MGTTDTDVSLGTAVAIGLGAAKTTDVIKKLLVMAGFDTVPGTVKALVATSVAAGLSILLEEGSRRRVLTTSASVGIASLAHTFERNQRHAGDVNKLVFLTEGARRVRR